MRSSDDRDFRRRAAPRRAVAESASAPMLSHRCSPRTRRKHADAADTARTRATRAVRLGRLYFGNTDRRRRRHHPALAGGRRGADRGAACPRPGLQALGAGVAARQTISTSRRPRRAPAPEAMADRGAGETVAAKGEVTGDGKRPRTPAERLGLDGKQRAKAEKCLAEAVYFEVARRAEARPDRGRPGGDEPGVLRLLPEQRLRRGLPERAPQARLPVHLRLRRHPRHDRRARHVGAGQGDRPRHARRQAVAAGDRPLHALPRLLGASVVGERDAEDLQDRRAQLLSAARLGRHRRSAEPPFVAPQRRSL